MKGVGGLDRGAMGNGGRDERCQHAGFSDGKGGHNGLGRQRQKWKELVLRLEGAG